MDTLQKSGRRVNRGAASGKQNNVSLKESCISCEAKARHNKYHIEASQCLFTSASRTSNVTRGNIKASLPHTTDKVERMSRKLSWSYPTVHIIHAWRPLSLYSTKILVAAGRDRSDNITGRSGDKRAAGGRE